MKNQKHLICCSTEKRKSQANSSELMLMKIASEQKRNSHNIDNLSKTNIRWIKKKQLSCWRKAVCWDSNTLNILSSTSANSIFSNITHSKRQNVWFRFMTHLKNERMCSLNDSDEVQRQRLHRCSFHDVSHIRNVEILCDTHKQSTMQKKIWHTSRTASFEIQTDEKDSCVIIEICITQNMQSDDDKRKSSVLINSSQKMIATSEQWVCEHHRDERTIQHQIESFVQICWFSMMLIQSQALIQKRKSTRTLNSYWMKFFDEQRMQHRWYFSETLSMKIDSRRDSENTSRMTRIESQSEFRYMMKNERLFEADSLKQTKKQKCWMNEYVIQIENTHHLKQNAEDFEAYHSIRTICWFLMFFDSILFQEIWFNMMRIADDMISISFRFELTLLSVRKNEAMNTQSISRDSNEIKSSILNQSDWTEKRKTFELRRTLCFNNIRDTMRRKWLLKQSHISKCWRTCSSVCEWLFKNTEQSKTKRRDCLKNKFCSKTRKCILHRDIEMTHWLNSCCVFRIENTTTESTQCFLQCNNKTRAFLFLHFRRWEENQNDIHQHKKQKRLKLLCVKDKSWCFWMKWTKIENTRNSQQKSRCLNFGNMFKRKKTNLTLICLNIENQEQMSLIQRSQIRIRYFYSLLYDKCQKELTQKLMNSHSNVKKTDILNRTSRLMNNSTILQAVWIDCVNAWRMRTKCKTNSWRLLKHTISMLICLQKRKRNVDMNTNCQRKSFCQIALTSSKLMWRIFRQLISKSTKRNRSKWRLAFFWNILCIHSCWL